MNLAGLLSLTQPILHKGGSLERGIENFPCPSADCWTYENGTNGPVCSIKANCSELQCSSTAMTVSFNSQLFGLDDGEDAVFRVATHVL